MELVNSSKVLGTGEWWQAIRQLFWYLPYIDQIKLYFKYCILLIIYIHAVLLFNVFTFIPKILSHSTAFTSFHSSHAQKFVTKLTWLWSNPWKTWNFFATNYKQYTVLASHPPGFKMSMQVESWTIFYVLSTSFLTKSL